MWEFTDPISSIVELQALKSASFVTDLFLCLWTNGCRRR